MNGSRKPLPTLNIVGTGKLGTTLPRLFADAGLARIQNLFNPNVQSARNAAAFIGSGQPVADAGDLVAADFWLLAVPDNIIAPLARLLAALPLPWQQSTVFHCSGITSSSILTPLAELGAATASAHPVHSFAEPARSLHSFAGTFCGLEGQPAAVRKLSAWFAAIGGQPLVINSDRKAIYHSGMTMAANNLVALLEASAQLLEGSGLQRQQAMQLLAPLVAQTAGNVFARGTDSALTGPVLRGDTETIDQHLQAIAAAKPHLLDSYKALGRISLAIARRQQQQTGEHSVALSERDRQKAHDLKQAWATIAEYLGDNAATAAVSDLLLPKKKV